ncbi:hypothetical protein ACI789_23035 [Geodermatophilus sp. SYSU D00965]
MVDPHPLRVDVERRRPPHEREAVTSARLAAARQQIALSDQRVQQLRELLATRTPPRPGSGAVDSGPTDPDRSLAGLEDDLAWALEQLEIRTQEVRSLQGALAESERELAATMRELRALNEELQELSNRAAERLPTGSRRPDPRLSGS